jgi:hypothetical protein
MGVKVLGERLRGFIQELKEALKVFDTLPGLLSDKLREVGDGAKNQASGVDPSCY